MHIPRQADGERADRTDGALSRAALAPVSGVDALRTRRRHLVQQLRAVVYWQRLVQARTDLLVAGLLYTSPVPASGRLSVDAGADPLAGLVWGLAPTAPPAHVGVSAGPAPADPSDLHALGCPPEGMDLDRLLDGIAAPGGTATGGTGEHLARLRGTAALLAAHHGEVQDELDLVTSALHEHLAADGAEETSLAR